MMRKTIAKELLLPMLLPTSTSPPESLETQPGTLHQHMFHFCTKMEKIPLQIKRVKKIKVCSQMWKAQVSNKYFRMTGTCDFVLFHLDTSLSPPGFS